jgi:hypothetical protein
MTIIFYGILGMIVIFMILSLFVKTRIFIYCSFLLMFSAIGCNNITYDEGTKIIEGELIVSKDKVLFLINENDIKIYTEQDFQVLSDTTKTFIFYKNYKINLLGDYSYDPIEYKEKI